ncbi:MAG: biotin--[Ruminococcus sp.]|nr:biotin--[acetyl-CoA-carboxylase] ligase [Ruminococcus sp.]
MKNKLLHILTDANQYISGQSLAKSLGISRQAVWKCVNTLRQEGCVIESAPNKGYLLVSLPPHINEFAIKQHLKTSVIGKKLIVLDTVGSTNDYLKSLGGDGCPNGTVVTTREQNRGKGRLGRSWIGNRDENIAFSVLLRPQLALRDVMPITPLAGLAICKALRKTTGLDCRIKWPNDIIVGKKKLVGILTEMSAEFDAVEYIVIGIGVNVDQTEFPEDIAHKATSILLQTGMYYEKSRLLATLLGEIERVFTRNRLELPPDTLKEYVALCATIGKSVAFQRNGHAVSGTAVDVTASGGLRVMLSDGTVLTVSSGEVTVQGIY